MGTKTNTMTDTCKPTSDDVLEMLRMGNQRFATGGAIHPHSDGERLALAGSQDQGDYAYATVLTCSDSRVPVERIFDAGVMDIFVIRVAGNVCNANEIGSVEYGLAHVHTPVLVLLGHTQCGAVSAMSQICEGGLKKSLGPNIERLLMPIEPAVKRAMAQHPELTGDQIIPLAIEENVWQSIADLFRTSAITRALVREGQVRVVGAIYNVGTGEIRWLPESRVGALLEEAEDVLNLLHH